MKYKYYIALILSILIMHDTNAQSTAEDIVFKINVTTNATNNSISLNWNTLPNVSSYVVSRKLKYAQNFVQIATKSYADTNFIDNNIVPGQSYEYAVHAGHTNNISGYVCAGINIAPKHNSGNILLVIDSTYIIPAQAEINLFKRDLIKEGWRVFVCYAGRQESPLTVKQRIQVCHSTSNLEGIILLGNIPVPYSGNIAPDAHSDHVGAWPSDIFYGDVNASSTLWTDVTVVNTSATSLRNHQLVGDGKFDISTVGYSNTQKIFVGRVDVSDMSMINSDDVFLFKQYINKNHAYRSATKKYRMQGLVHDNFGYYYGEAFAQNGWRNISSLLGRDSVKAGVFMNDLKNESYLWSYACGGGWYTSSIGIGTTADFQTNQLQTVFTMLYGSYFGDWDNSNNFLRAPIASPSGTLVTCWAGRPNWFLHTMSLGDPFGYGFANTVGNTGSYFPKGFANAQVHQSIQGDPTLKMYMYEAPTNVEAFAEVNNTVKLQWTASVDPSVTGYYVYRANNIDGAFQLLTPSPITSLSFIDNNPLSMAMANMTAYMVKAVKLQQTVTGTFYNLSPGEITEGFSDNTPLPVHLISFTAKTNSDNTNTISWQVAKEENISGYEIERSSDLKNYESLGFIETKNTNALSKDYAFDDNFPGVNNYYRLKIIDIDNSISYNDKIVYLRKSGSTLDDILYPNPVINNLNLRLGADYADQSVEITIFDMRGRIMLYSSKAISPSNNVINLAVEKFATGNYILRYKKEDELNVGVLKFAKIE